MGNAHPKTRRLCVLFPEAGESPYASVYTHTGKDFAMEKSDVEIWSLDERDVAGTTGEMSPEARVRIDDLLAAAAQLVYGLETHNDTMMVSAENAEDLRQILMELGIV